EITAPLLGSVPAAFHGGVNDALLTALAVAVAEWRRRRGRGSSARVLVDVEGHGREEIAAGVDLSRTVGWFTSLFPVALDPGAASFEEVASGAVAAGRAVKAVKEQQAALPDHGIGYGLLAYLNPDAAATPAGPAPGATARATSPWRRWSRPTSTSSSPSSNSGARWPTSGRSPRCRRAWPSTPSRTTSPKPSGPTSTRCSSCWSSLARCRP